MTPRTICIGGYDLTYLSLGAGVQSTALLICSNLGLHNVPRADVAIFADTGDEPAEVYRHLWVLASWSQIPIEIVSQGHLSQDILHKRSGQRAMPPLFLRNPDGSKGFLRRQCTQTYKIRPIERRVRQILGVKPRCRVKKGVKVRALLGISLDESDRMRDNKQPWTDNAYPLIDARLTRTACEKICLEHLGRVPEKSACRYCPFHSDGAWRRLRDLQPDEFLRAVEFDRKLRDAGLPLRGMPYVHPQRVPLDKVDFGDGNGDLFAEECSGICGV